MAHFTYAGANDRMNVGGINFPNGHAVPVSDKTLQTELRARGDFAEAAADFNGADPAKFDHDNDKRPGGSKPKGKRVAKKAKA